MKRWFFLILSGLLMEIGASVAPAQTDLKPIDQIRETQLQVLVIPNVKQFNERYIELVKELGFEGMAAPPFVFEKKGEFEEAGLAAFYISQAFRNPVIQRQIKSEELVQERAGKDVDLSEIFKIESSGFRTLIFSDDDQWGVVRENELISSSDQKQLQAFLEAKPLTGQVNPRMAELVNRSGISLLAKVRERDRPNLSESLKRTKPGTFTKEEMETVRKIDQALESADRFGVGLTYDRKCLTLNSLVSFKKNEVLQEIVSFENLKRKFHPTRGLSDHNLISSFSMQLDAMHSPTMARLLPKMLRHESRMIFRSEWLNGRMIQTAAELLADSWHEVQGIKLGLYEVDDLKNGPICIVGVVEARDGEAMMAELRKLVTLVDPEKGKASKEAFEAEIAALIKQLGSRKYTVRQRATTRLMLAGRAAMEPLQAAMESSNTETRARIHQVLRKLELEAQDATKDFAVGDVDFWSNLRPEFSMASEKVNVGGHACHLLRIHPDSSKSAEKVSEASAYMAGAFGPSWDKIYLAPVGNQYVFMVGSDQERFLEVVENVKSGADPIADRKVIHRQNIQTGQVQFHFSLAHLANLTEWMGRREPVEPGDNNLSSISIVLGRESWGLNLYLPLEELKILTNRF